MKWQDRPVLVTGAGGFIGSHLVDELLKKGADVTAFVHYNARNDWGMLEGRYTDATPHLKVIAGDVTDALFVRKAVAGKEVVFHLAALIGIPYSYVAPESYVNTNIKGTLNVMQACLDEDVSRIVHTSTSETYGTAQYTPIDEQHPLQGQSPYSASKIGADKIAESFYCSFGLPVTTIRPFNTFGPRQSTRAVIPTIITQALTSDTVRLGSLTPVRDLTYVADTVAGFIRLAESKKTVGRTINTGSGRGVTIGELADIIIGKTNPKAKVICEEKRIRPDKSEVMELLCDNRLAAELAGWKPAYTLEKGLDLTIGWMKEHLASYKTGVYTV
ncbi:MULTISPECIES: SDR family NAD(P)-dependent oxidoreductase [unclassified Methanoregula]|uniref:SDR family NAD(P)-dependent oxidoreductase n=1 Tax=unclassified Methanoregula TaxID=2649730 RepID=UPI0009D2D1CC|nr:MULTISPECIES: SDR family NAD(P)-dependent oxidoreductase [unclassified Methanoregula]OPX63686.1 MAG: dTDP-glucose 4,6-dehydratase [Methanoregula sp. PtaB.Bin085]OPY36147.1 MAG: dTDP-glucose 4,6-dehydratase [Methanoregula sp. PtaU1.Bin006]